MANPSGAVSGGGVLHSNAGQLYWWTGTTDYKLSGSPPAPYFEIVLVAGQQTTKINTFPVMIGARSFDTTQFPATIGTLNRYVKFIATLQNTAGATKTTVSLYDVRNAVTVTGTSMDNSGSVSMVLPYDVTSGVLTLGTASGNIRTDSAGMYEVQLQMVGGTSSDASTCSNARLIVYYV